MDAGDGGELPGVPEPSSKAGGGLAGVGWVAFPEQSQTANCGYSGSRPLATIREAEFSDAVGQAEISGTASGGHLCSGSGPTEVQTDRPYAVIGIVPRPLYGMRIIHIRFV